jgi:two-component system chemotaxis response regulator CheY
VSQNKPILVVDDDPDIVAVVAEILELEGYTVERATNGQEALECVGRVRPRLVFLDMRMPVLNGWEFARILSERGIKLPIVVMTAAQDAQQWAQEIGARDYLAKPFDLLEVLDMAENCTGPKTGPLATL